MTNTPTKEFETILLEPNEQITPDGPAVELKPTKLYLLPAGSIEDKLSFAIELSTKNGPKIYGQLSLAMLVKSLTPEHLEFLAQQLKLDKNFMSNVSEAK